MRCKASRSTSPVDAETRDYQTKPSFLVEQSQEKASFIFNPATAVGGFLSTIRFDAAHSFTQNQAVVYRDNGTVASQHVTNLVSGSTYYVDVVDAQTIRLLNAARYGTVIAIGVPASLATSYSLDSIQQLDVTLGSSCPHRYAVQPLRWADGCQGGGQRNDHLQIRTDRRH